MTAAHDPAAGAGLSEARTAMEDAFADRVTWDDGTEYIAVDDAARVLAARVAAAEEERDDLREEYDSLERGYNAQVRHGRKHYERAEAAECARAEVEAKVRAAVDRLAGNEGGWPHGDAWFVRDTCVEVIRAALSDAPEADAPVPQRDGGERAIRERVARDIEAVMPVGPVRSDGYRRGLRAAACIAREGTDPRPSGGCLHGPGPLLGVCPNCGTVVDEAELARVRGEGS